MDRTSCPSALALAFAALSSAGSIRQHLRTPKTRVADRTHNRYKSKRTFVFTSRCSFIAPSLSLPVAPYVPGCLRPFKKLEHKFEIEVGSISRGSGKPNSAAWSKVGQARRMGQSRKMDEKKGK